MRTRFSPSAILSLLGALTLPALCAEPPIVFSRDILPILSDHCFQCHGPDAKEGRKGDLRLDVESDAKRKRDGSSVITPFQPDQSTLVERIRTDDPEDIMPPPKTGRPLNDRQKALLHRWIAEGAKWGTHWSFERIVRPAVPAGYSNPIDAFVGERLKQAGLKPNPKASEATLLRRMSLDLNGLPPRIQRDQFAPSPAPTASPISLPDHINALLDSPAFGERMAWDWLDAARYADSNGYQGDGERTMWPWRDWVVKSFNEGLPFDQFTLWQIAGDLLPNATHDQKLATGFNRNHMINGEGGRIAEENRVDYVMDMTETTGTVWMGLTFNCCRCHDHKFDPLTQADYYRLSAFFNQTPVTGGGGNPQTPPVLPCPTPEQEQRTASVRDAQTSALTTLRTLEKQQFPKDAKGKLIPLDPALGGPIPQDVIDALNTDAASRKADQVDRLTKHFAKDRTDLVDAIKAHAAAKKAFDDWLAAEFIESGWNVKHLLRIILTSETYQRSSDITDPSHLESDPQNRLLARGPRFRMPSWMIRDQALAVSGLLDPKVGGRPVNPYQPAGIWEEATFGKQRYPQSSGPDLYRRSIYTFWKRIVSPTAFFDSAKRQVCEVKPLRTNTPMHALATLNDPTFVEAARTLASLVLQSSSQNDDERLTLAVRRVLGREPTPAERVIHARSLVRSLDVMRRDNARAKALIGIGDSKAPTSLDPAMLAAWTNLCLNLLNLDEALTKE